MTCNLNSVDHERSLITIEYCDNPGHHFVWDRRSSCREEVTLHQAEFIIGQFNCDHSQLYDQYWHISSLRNCNES